MSQVINTNIASLTAQNNLNKSQSALNTAIERLSSGLRINSAKDDAAGLAISQRFTAQINGLNQASRNANDGISFAQTAEGALGTIGDSLQRVRQLAVQAANDTNSSSDRQALNNEVSQLISEVNRVAGSTQFNGQNVLDGSAQKLVFQVGANQGQTISVSGVDARGSQLGARVAEGGSVSESDLSTAIGNDSLTIQGTHIDLSNASSVNDVIAAVNNKTADTGVQAQQATNVDTGDIASNLDVPTGTTGALTINGTSVAVANDGSDAVDLAKTAQNINALTEQTGVTATYDSTGGTLKLSNTSGVDISLGGANFNTGTSETYHAGVVLAGNVGKAFTVSGSYTDTAGTSDALSTATQNDQQLNDTSVLTRSDATKALQTLDFALQQVNGQRAQLGAVQNRFQSTISNLATSSQNLDAARSRIQDTDFAAETAALTKNQVLKQAGTAVLAQANKLPNTVLALLQ